METSVHPAEGLISAAAERGLTLAGSLLAVAPGARAGAATQLWARRAWAHADVIDGRFGSRPSLGFEEIGALAARNAARTDVHLMVDDPADWCRRLPPVGRVTVQLHREMDRAEVAGAVRDLGADLWWAVAPEFASGDVLARLLATMVADPSVAPDGVLVLLTPPGRGGFAPDTARLADVRVARGAVDEVGVDGGVGPEHLDAVSASGASFVVCGRSLFSPNRTAPTGMEIADEY